MNTEAPNSPETDSSINPAPGLDLSMIKKPEALMSLPEGGSPYAFDQMFPLTGFSNKRLAKAKLKKLKLLDPVLRSMLHEGETVLYMTDGVKQNTIEQLFIGWMVYYYNHNAFIFTTERILMIHLESKRKLGKFIGVISYGDLIKVKPSFLGSLSLKFRNKKSIAFSRIPRKDRKFIKEFLNPLIADNKTAINKQAPTITDLCPNCYHPVLTKTAASCSHCELEFKTPKQAALRSLILPGLGDIYLGSKLGYFEAFFMAIIWFTMIAGNLEMISTGEAKASEAWIGTFVVLGVIHLIDAIKIHYVAKKGIFPKESIHTIRLRNIT